MVTSSFFEFRLNALFFECFHSRIFQWNAIKMFWFLSKLVVVASAIWCWHIHINEYSAFFHFKLRNQIISETAANVWLNGDRANCISLIERETFFSLICRYEKLSLFKLKFVFVISYPNNEIFARKLAFNYIYHDSR